MSDNPLSGKVGLDTTDFKTAISTLNREIRVVESGFRAAAAGLDDWSKDASGLELRIKALNGQIDLQKAKVGALTGEYERVAKEKGETSKAAQDLQIRLNKETESLNKMQGELGQTEAALDGMGDESKSTGGDVEKLKKEEDKASTSTKTLGVRLGELKKKLQDTGAGIRSAVGTVAKLAAGLAVGLAGAVAAAGAGIGALIVKTAAAADEIVESAEKIGISAEQYQEFKFIGDQVGTSVEDIGKAFGKTTKLIGSATGGNRDAAKTFKDLGVSLKDSSGNLRSAQDVTFDLIAALGRMTDETQRDILSQQIFGKGFQELAPLINLGAEGAAAMTEQARALGAVMSEEAVRGAADLNDKMGALKAGLGGLGGRIAGAFVPLVSKAADALTNWLSSPAVQRGVEALVHALDLVARAIDALLSGNLNDAITFFQMFAFELAKLFGAGPEDAAKFAGGIARGLEGIAGWLKAFLPQAAAFVKQLAAAFGQFITQQLVPFIQAHGPEIKAALVAVGAALVAVGVIVPIVGAVIAALTSPIALIVAAIALLAAAWAGNWGGIRDTITQLWEGTLKPFFTELIARVQENLPKALAFLSDIWTGVLQPAIKTVGDFIRDVVIPILSDIWTWLSTNVPAAIQTVSTWFTGTLIPAIQDVWNFINTYLVPIFVALGELLSVTVSVIVENLAKLWKEKLQPALENVQKFIQDHVIPIFDELGKFIDKTLRPVLEWLEKFLVKNIKEAWEGIIKTLQTLYEWILKAIEAMQKLRPAKEVEPGSPTPFERGLRGISDAARTLRSDLDSLQASFTGLGGGGIQLNPVTGGGGGLAGGLAPIHVTVQATIHTPLDIPSMTRQIAEEIQRRQRR